jgi:hypothetical protein
VKDEKLVEGDAWSSYPTPKDLSVAREAAALHYGVSEV